VIGSKREREEEREKNGTEGWKREINKGIKSKSKVVPVLNQLPHYEDTLESGYITPRPGRITPRERAPGTL
jgi:hypothetical protein